MAGELTGKRQTGPDYQHNPPGQSRSQGRNHAARPDALETSSKRLSASQIHDGITGHVAQIQKKRSPQKKSCAFLQTATKIA
jgi:hypothetical protein